MRYLYAYQERIVDTIFNKREYALFMEQGTGKTQVILSEFYRDKDKDTLIVVGAPNGLQYVWEREVEANGMDMYVFSWQGKRTAKVEGDIQGFFSTSKRKIVLCNIEVFQCEGMFMKILAELMGGVQRSIFVVDQSSCIKTAKSLRSRNIRKVCHAYREKIYKKRILEGDACSGGLHELYSQYSFLRHTIIGVPTYKAFKNKFCIVEGVWDKIVGYKNKRILWESIKPYTEWLKSEDCIELPELIDKVHEFELSGKEKKHFKEVDTTRKSRTYKKAEDDDDEETDVHQLTLLLRLQCICSGILEIEEGIESTKIQRLKGILRDEIESRRVVIFCNYHFEVELITKMLKGEGIAYGEYHGKNEKTRTGDLDRFVGGETQVLLGTQGALSKGFTLVNKCNDVIFYSRNWSYRLYYEAVKRVHRNGQKNKVIIHNLISKGTVENEIVKALRNKKDLLHLAYELYQKTELSE